MANGLNGLRRLLRAAILFCGSIAALVAIYLLAAIAGGLIAGPTATLPPSTQSQTIALVIGPIHTDVLLPLTPATRAAFAFTEAHGLPITHPDAQWLITGWGARGVFTTMGTWGDVRLPTLLRAVTGDTAVIRLDVAGAFDTTGVAMIPVTDAQLASLTRTIRASMTGAALPDAGFTDTDRYYPAAGYFHMLRTCNVWVGETLRSAGIPFGSWTPTPFAMRLSLWRFHSPG
jgi:uncharacterized protein (TIGR02117 family)